MNDLNDQATWRALLHRAWRIWRLRMQRRQVAARVAALEIEMGLTPEPDYGERLLAKADLGYAEWAREERAIRREKRERWKIGAQRMAAIIRDPVLLVTPIDETDRRARRIASRRAINQEIVLDGKEDGPR